MRDKTFRANIFSEDFHEIITLCEYTSVMLCIFGCTNFGNVRVKIELLIVEEKIFFLEYYYGETFYTLVFIKRGNFLHLISEKHFQSSTNHVFGIDILSDFLLLGDSFGDYIFFRYTCCFSLNTYTHIIS